jgi:hypothetical protein
MTNKIQLSPMEMAKLADLMVKISHDPKTRPYAAQLVKAVSPDDAKAFHDIETRSMIEGLRREFKAEREKDQIAAVTRARENQKREVIKKYKYTPDQVSRLEAIQAQYGFSDWSAAAKIYQQDNPPDNPDLKPPPQYTDGSSWDFPTVPGPDGKMLEFKDYVKDPRKYSNKTAWSMITDFKRGVLPSAFQ